MEKNKVKLIYLTVATIPNKTAHSKYVMKLCEAFARQGVDVTVVSGKPIKEKNKLKILFKIVRIPICECKYKSLILSIFHFFYILKRKIFIQSKDDIYIVHSAITALFCSILKVNYIVDMHGKIFNQQKAKKILFKYKPLFWIVQSNLLFNFVNKKIGISKSKIFLSRNAVDKVEKFKNIDKFDKNNNRINIAYIGRLEPKTGFDDIVKAINELDNIIVYVGGNYEKHKKYYKELFEKYPKSKEKIVFLGYLNDEEINYVCQKSDILMALYNSNISIMGALSPMKMFEYLRFNKRIIAPKIQDIEEIVEYYNCEDRMRWYEMDDIDSLKETIIRAISEPKNLTFKPVQVETWDDKAKNILKELNNVVQ